MTKRELNPINEGEAPTSNADSRPPPTQAFFHAEYLAQIPGEHMEFIHDKAGDDDDDDDDDSSEEAPSHTGAPPPHAPESWFSSRESSMYVRQEKGPYANKPLPPPPPIPRSRLRSGLRPGLPSPVNSVFRRSRARPRPRPRPREGLVRRSDAPRESFFARALPSRDSFLLRALPAETYNENVDTAYLERGPVASIYDRYSVFVKPKDPNVIDFDGLDDPDLGTNWSARRKWWTIATLSVQTFITPLASSMFAPGVPGVLADFHSRDAVLGSFVVSVFILGYAIGPLVIAPLSEQYGRTHVYNVTNVLFVLFTIACALSTDMTMLIILRFLEGCAGSAVLTMGGATIADLFIQEERGGAMALWGMGPLVGPVVGPVCGGFLSQAKGWRWVFWVIAAFSGFTSIVVFFVLKETYAPIILERRVARLRKETGNTKLRSALASGLTPTAAFRRAIVRPIKMLLFSPICACLSLLMAINYGYLYLLFTTITAVFQTQYQFSSGAVGLTFLGLGIGMMGGLIIFGGVSDRLLKAKAAAGEMKPEYRLPPMIPAAFLIPVGLFIYGWSAEKNVAWMVPILGTSLVGLGILGTFLPIQTYLVDAFSLHAASAVAANTVLRSLAGAFLPLAGPAMYTRLGLGWGNSLLAFIAVVLVPVPWLFYVYGERLRKHPRFQLNL